MFQMPESLPEPTSTVTRNGKNAYGVVQRNVKTKWVLNPEAEGVPFVVVTLTTSHGESWRSYEKTSGYTSRMTWGTYEPTDKYTGAFSVETWSSDNATVGVTPMVVVPRHSLKAMEAAHAAALAVASEHFEQLAHVFEQAAEKSGLFEMAEA